ncbi:Flp pilus assembly protein CpaB [Falsiroseomonas sp. E2-1-a4]|uniref:Flp pilus assembly protein CpaB n=1 Tax=Falsiroseomonas sp. E2-1-a4 TaxID=3239299 RepID=UPI003F3C066A
MILRILVVLSLIITAAGLGALGTQMLAPQAQAPSTEIAAPAPPPPPVLARMLVAARALPAGTLLKEEDFTTREIAPELLPEGAVPPTDTAKAELRGAMLRHFMEAGAPLDRAQYLRPRDRGFLAAVLAPGKRAISVGVDVVTGAAGLIWPGDQVDLILTQELAAGDAPLARRVVGETLLTDVRVIAVDQQITQGATGAEATANRIARTVTLEVTSAQAERVAVGSRLGRLALTVRAIEAELPLAIIVPPGSVFGEDVSPALARAGLSQGLRMRVIQGDETQNVLFR